MAGHQRECKHWYQWKITLYIRYWFLFETKFMIWKCRNYEKYEHSEVFLTKSHKYLDAKLNSILLYNNIVDCDIDFVRSTTI